MAQSREAFGDFLREMIKQTGITQAAFYAAVGITKPYFYDILSGKINPPPPAMESTKPANSTSGQTVSSICHVTCMPVHPPWEDREAPVWPQGRRSC